MIYSAQLISPCINIIKPQLAEESGKWKLHLHPTLTLYDLENDPGERNPVNNRTLKRKLRGMAVLFQEEMRLFARPAGTAK